MQICTFVNGFKSLKIKKKLHTFCKTYINIYTFDAVSQSVADNACSCNRQRRQHRQIRRCRLKEKHPMFPYINLQNSENFQCSMNFFMTLQLS